jgi:arylsulfatase A-like enzyme/Flp pilus assembly protein TadD
MKARIVAIVVVAGLGAIWLLRREAAPRRTEARMRPSVLLVTIDTLRADRVGAYGGPAGLTPNIDALAAQGAVFEEALASVPLTLPSHATILSGLEPPHHGVRDNGTYVFPEGRETLATRLQAAGYATGAFMAAYVLDRRFGLARGFTQYDDAIDRRQEGASVLESERRGETVVAAAEAWLGGQHGPYFAWVHLYDPHAPYDPPSPFREKHAGALYDGEVAYADACVGRLLAAARRRAENLVVVVLADHGESLGEHGERTHGFFVYQSTLRIPLIVAGPGVPTRRVPGLARTADVTPTILRLLGMDPLPQIDGMDLLASGRPRESYAETYYPRSLGWSPLHSYRVGSLKLIDAPRPELYDLSSDPLEQRDRASTDPAQVTRLRAALAGARQGETSGAKSASDPEVAERLRALGYVTTGSTPVSAESALADPKDRIERWQLFEEGTWAEGRGDLASAVTTFRRLVQDEPGNATFRRSLAAVLRKSGNARAAADALNALETLAPDDPLAWHEAAVSLAAAGKLDEAVRAERRAIALGPTLPELHNHLGILLERGGALPAALEAFMAATRLDPNNARAWNNQANALRSLGQTARAAEAYRNAARLAPRDPDPRNGLGVLAVESGDLETAGALFREILAANPALHESRMNLAVVYVRQNRVADARAELRTILGARPDRATAARAAAFLRDIS